MDTLNVQILDACHRPRANATVQMPQAKWHNVTEVIRLGLREYNIDLSCKKVLFMRVWTALKEWTPIQDPGYRLKPGGWVQVGLEFCQGVQFFVFDGNSTFLGSGIYGRWVETSALAEQVAAHMGLLFGGLMCAELLVTEENGRRKVFELEDTTELDESSVVLFTFSVDEENPSRAPPFRSLPPSLAETTACNIAEEMTNPSEVMADFRSGRPLSDFQAKRFCKIAAARLQKYCRCRLPSVEERNVFIDHILKDYPHWDKNQIMYRVDLRASLFERAVFNSFYSSRGKRHKKMLQFFEGLHY